MRKMVHISSRCTIRQNKVKLNRLCISKYFEDHRMLIHYCSIIRGYDIKFDRLF